MKVATKFDYGEKVFYMSHNKVNYGTITEITINAGQHIISSCGNYNTTGYSILVKYRVGDRTLPESECFKTKEELINSL